MPLRGLAAMGRADAARVPPAWLRPMLDTEYFGGCLDHPQARGSRGAGACNLFCTGCPDRAICASCLPSHPGHKTIQIRRSSNSNVVRVADVEDLLQVSDVQPYLLNGHAAVFLKKRPMAGKGRAGEVRCEECERTLLNAAYRFCSIGCKLDALPNDLDFTVSFVVPPKSDDETESDSSSHDDDQPSAPTSAQDGEGESSSAMAAKPSSGQHGHSKGVPKNI
nr:unnamed protein product [Digitaria exilis]